MILKIKTNLKKGGRVLIPMLCLRILIFNLFLIQKKLKSKVNRKIKRRP